MAPLEGISVDGTTLKFSIVHEANGRAFSDKGPFTNNVTATTLEGTAMTLNVLADASDPSGYTLSLSTFTQPAHGKVAENTGSTLTYTPAAGYLGADAFTYTVSVWPAAIACSAT